MYISNLKALGSKRIATWIVVFFTIGGCKKFVQIGPPATQLVTASVFDNSAAATSAQTNIYLQMASSGQSWLMSQYLGQLSDELISYSTIMAEKQFYTNAMSAVTGVGPWSTAYNYIYQANAIIEGLQNNNSIFPSIAQQLIGESKFIRAFWHFYLANCYGDIPLVTTTNYTINGVISRTSQQRVYSQIIADLTDAQQLLSSNYVDASDTTVTTERVRPTKWAAAALLARVYLYVGKYDSAEMESTLVLNNSNYNLCTNLSSKMGTGTNYVFEKNSTEAIWQLSTPLPVGVATNTADGAYFSLAAAPGASNNNSTSINSQLLNSFEPGDLRKTYWIGVFNTGSPTISYYYAYKYQNTTTTITEYVMVLRLAEQYLIHAEAEANLGDMVDAAKDLNVIRARAGLGPSTILTADATLQQADSAIMHERRVELFVEWGHRWFDLIRTGAIDSVMGSPIGVCQAKGGSWTSSAQLFPIPLSEINNDRNLSQNPGY